MKNIFFYITLAFIVSCGNERELQLPEIDKAAITEIQDVSVAYLFYDETQPDSVLLNRKNLISTTNWLVNVDKRLTLKQAIPHIKFLQDKKKSSSHKNENAKNYFTCHDLSINNLGFLEFTSTNYNVEKPEMIFSDISDLKYSGNIHTVNFEVNEDILIFPGYALDINIATDKKEFTNEIKKLDTLRGRIILNFHKNLKFEDYILYKSLLSNINLNHLSISNQEYLYN
ncbi:hypothetical protein [Hyunsoonleella pacifica]|uniref:Lipoprotein n=1 Tax=Hyunsoonleella pacifica TaxID=1080224 RepID=A0A4Q9FMV7_9FLAO|nr:hypothetical protein [Hyunsoonleella pacifica]TBN13150.1 hypothetical protein EYD46_16785 [Hyunsoonleella pacifica]GGD28576.1 hypothetical protein GCM10011368_33230 [Hyunsoonleella pacifica]